MSNIVYLYGFVSHDAPTPPADLAGIGGSAIELFDIGPLRAVLTRLDDVTYTPAQLDRHFQDLAWVGEQALAHERVVAWFVDHDDILPARLFTLHSSIDALRDAVSPDAHELTARLRKFRGLREWNLKVAYDSIELSKHGGEVSSALQSVDREIADAPAGRRYLLERKRADLAKRELRQAAKRLAHELLDELAVHAVARRVLPLSQDPASGAVVLTAALLVARANEAALQHEAAKRIDPLTQLGMIVSFSGPWAPYRFVEQDVDA